MSSCIYCGETTGFLRKQHKACLESHEIAAATLPQFFVKSLDRSIDPARFRALAAGIASSHYVRESEFCQLVRQGMESMIEVAFANGIISEEHEFRIECICNQFGVTANNLGSAGDRLLEIQVQRCMEQSQGSTNAKVNAMRKG